MTLNANVSHYFDNHDYFEYLKQHCSDDTLVGASGRITGLEQMQDFFERMEFTPQHTTLEVGCGTGRVLKVLHRQYDVVAHGVDPCSEAIAYARKELPEHAGNLHHIADGRLSMLPAQSYDRIVFWGVFELCEPQDTIVQVARMLRPGGLALLNNMRNRNFRPDDEDVAAALKAYREKKIPIWQTDAGAFEALFEALGLEIKERAVFETKADVVANTYATDQSAMSQFAEATYILHKTALTPLDVDVGRLPYD